MVPRMARAEKAEPYRDQILEWVDRCRGNLVRVHEELVAQGVAISYPALTAFCRRHAIGHEPPAPVGHYDLQPAQEMQHDTSPHRAAIAGVEQRIETASLVLCYSRMLFFQACPVFTRLPEEQTLAQADPPVPAYAAALKQRSAGRGTLALRRLLALYREYPRTPFLRSVTLAAQYGLFALDRPRRLPLRVIAKEYFLLSEDDEEPR